MASALELLNRVLETGDGDEFAARLAPGAVVWHNYDNLEIGATDNMNNIGLLQEMVADLRVDVLRRAEFPGGAFQQVVIRGTVRASGRQLAAQNCIIVLETDGKITRIEEYVDPTVGQQLSAPAEA